LSCGNVIIANGGTWNNEANTLGEYAPIGNFSNRGGLFASSSAFKGDDNHYIESDSAVDYSGNEATYECWFNSDAAHGYILQHWGSTYGFYLRIDGINLQLTFKDAQFSFSNETGYRDQRWHHCAIVIEDTVCKWYLDGKLVQEDTGSSWGSPNTEFAVGGDTYQFDGHIANARIFEDPRTAAEIRANMFEETPAGDNLVLNYVFNEGEGTIINDSANSNDGKIYNYTTSVADPSWATGGTWTAGGILSSSAGNLYIGNRGTDATVFASSYFPIGNRKLISGSKFASKSHGGTDFYYVATSGTNDYMNYSALAGAPIVTANDLDILANSYFSFDSSANNNQCDEITNYAGSTVRIVKNADFYTQDFDNQGTWLRNATYDGIIHDDGSTPHEYEPIDIMDDQDSPFDAEDLID